MRTLGFTMIELVLVIAVLGILSLAAFSRYFDLARTSEMNKIYWTIGAVRAGIAIHKGNQLATFGANGAYPQDLGSNFSAVLDDSSSATLNSWSSDDNVNFTYNHGGIVSFWAYDSVDGVMTCSGDCP